MAEPRKSINYEAVVASAMALLALLVSAYTAWIQRQQVRAQVMPLLEYGTSNQPALTLELDNKGVGPARVEHVVITFDDRPLHDWNELGQALFRPGEDVGYSVSLLGNHILSPGERLNMYTLTRAGQPIGVGKEGSPEWRFNQDRLRVGVEICYCSTLDECWTLKVRRQETPEQVPTARCPQPNERSFRQ